MSNNLKSLFLMIFALLVSSCSDHTPPSEDEVQSFFLQSSTFASAVDQGRLTVNAFKVTSRKSRDVADQELYKAKFVANISISPADCSNQPKVDCDANAVQNQEVKGTAEFEWDGDGWSKAGLVLNK